MASNDSPHYPNVYVPAIMSRDDDWVFRDIYERVLTGQLLDPNETVGLFHDFLEDGELSILPEDLAHQLELSNDEIIIGAVRSLWETAHDTASAWRHDETDTDRFYRAVQELHDDAEIVVTLFGSIFDVDGFATIRGVGALAADAWRQFDASAPVDITLAIDSRDLDTLISAVAIDVADAFTREGLCATINDDYSVTVTVQWRHHVLSYEESLAAVALISQESLSE